MTVLVLDPSAWVEQAGSLDLPGSPLGDGPTVIVLDGSWAGVTDRGGGSAPPPVPVVGRLRGTIDPSAASLSERCDVLVGDTGDEAAGAVGGGDRAVEHLTAAIVAHPLPAAVLCQVLRRVGDLDVATGLLVESLAYATLQAGPDHRAWLDGRDGGVGREHAASLPPVVRVDRLGDHLAVELHRPEVHNALDVAMRDALVEAFDLVASDPSIASAVLTGAGPSFCAGGDLSEFGTTPGPAVAHAVRSLRLPARSIARIADRVQAVVHGACVGAGVELAAFACDVQASPDTTFRLPELAMGLIPGAGGTVSLPRRIGRHRAGWLALSGQPLGAPDALSWGLVDRIGPPVGPAN